MCNSTETGINQCSVRRYSLEEGKAKKDSFNVAGVICYTKTSSRLATSLTGSSTRLVTSPTGSPTRLVTSPTGSLTTKLQNTENTSSSLLTALVGLVCVLIVLVVAVRYILKSFNEQKLL